MGFSRRVAGAGAVIAAVVVGLPMAVALGADDRPAILKGRVTDEAHAPLADARILVAVPAIDMRFADTDMTGRLARAAGTFRLVETRADSKGEYRLTIPGLSGRTSISIDAKKPGFRRLSGTLMAGGDDRHLDVRPGETTEAAPLLLKPAGLHVKGVVVDEQGKPIPALEINASVMIGKGVGGVEVTTTRADGTFEIFNYPPKADYPGKLGKGRITFTHPDYIENSVDDIYALDPAARESVRVVLPAGRRLSGTVLDNDGKPVAGALVEASRKGGADRKATLTDAAGKFALRGLVGGISAVTARSLKLHQARSLPIALNGDRPDLEIQLRPMVLPANLKPQAVLGMRLADVTPEIQAAYGLFNDRGAIILDPGEDPGRLAIGDLEEGNVFWMVGQTRVGSVREFVNQLLSEVNGPNVAGGKIRVVYSFRTVDFVGSSTQYMKLTPEDLKELKALAERLDPEPR
ncbi:carboxypeptidase-like regulatory domain-containing protein [Aquisphaera insulae]|uniref:carboxypeptidase-like regulatory domain-containing protein n=1 Tax=Aquisphaera insulae TaxID=2712864 RepID=UPI0013ECCD7A|nr:carboxypeptidase-like regulatory domain-containing protein [Aquisphaera insulae]